ncbi:MFS transporter [Mesobacterium pallidum]|uniref:MFS transporter n=1 Tax=Mesobacterium pallidum TaxID=2872037 RepID=UPI001EE1FFDE|nr:MFS transporter [Mesobacterium pallidum]
MLSLFRNRTYAALFGAQVVALLGTGLLTVALGLLAYDLAGAQAGQVLGTAYAIKMVAYVGLSPLAQALLHALPRKAVLIGADLVRLAVALCLPLVSETWQVYALIFALQAASATFTPTYQAVLPDILPDEARYTRALSLSRLAYDLEMLVSPALAGLMLLVIGYSDLFLGTALGFAGSALLVWRARIPALGQTPAQGFMDRLTRGLRLYLATPRLRGLLALTFAGAGASAFVLVNTVVLTRAQLGGGDSALGLAMAAFGAGSMVVALALPRWLDRRPDRPVMLRAALALGAVELALAAWLLAGIPCGWAVLLPGWALMGAGYSAIATPAGRLIRRSAEASDRPALFAAHFALSHACWLVTYPLAGSLGAGAGLGPTLALLALSALAAAALAARLWRPETGGQSAR